MKTKFKDVVLSALIACSKNGVEEKDVVFLVDKNQYEDYVLWGIGIKGIKYIGDSWIGDFNTKLRKFADANDGDYEGILGYSFVCTFRKGYGLIFFMALKNNWDFYMKGQEKDWKEFSFYKDEHSCNILKVLSRLFCKKGICH